MSRPPRLAWLFDVDGTLLTTEGAAREAFALAVRQSLGILAEVRVEPTYGVLQGGLRPPVPDRLEYPQRLQHVR